ncbi:MAG: DUF6766 family protein, partial [Candidatus Binatia bacterium]
MVRYTRSRGCFSSAKKNRQGTPVFYENGLSIVLFCCFLAFWGGQALTGHRQYNEHLKEHG